MRIKYFISVILIFSIFISCDDSFSPKAPYDERYSLNCIIRGDTSFQVATTYKNYDVSYIDPYENKEDSFIDGAFIRMWRGNDEISIFKDTTMERTDQSRFKTDIKYYYINGFVPTAGDSLEIEALLPNGRRLRSNTKVPKEVKRNEIYSDMVLTRSLVNHLRTSWEIKNQNLVYLPKLVLCYYEKVNGVNIWKEKIIPWKKLKIDNETKYIYPSPSGDYLIDYDVNIIKEAMEDISKNDSEKGKYTIIYLWLELSIFDENLSTYFFTVGLEDNSLAIGLDEGDYSNIENGFGIFGSYFTQRFKISVTKGYVNSFGYILYEE
ncbi:MAG: DUF4249 domain-containing protein [Bacteroidetes bacterium]|nr:DUF4249 domain-containing protein [Bacteroidota bacterium]MBU1114542.1 DUF4249 domain-containing protein [Bacteroidota bacterium]MBU1798621.1 DUF4249 domain-containing protein [Bacteroidota bacterium]